MLVPGTAKRIFPVLHLRNWRLDSPANLRRCLLDSEVHRRAGMSIAGMVADARQIVSWEPRCS